MNQTNLPLKSTGSSAMDTGRAPLFARAVLEPMTRVLNPLVVRLAGKRHFGMAAQVHHRGRRSGRMHVTPASARRKDGAFYIPLTFGRRSQWCRNVLAAGGCGVRYRGAFYELDSPQVVDLQSAMAAARTAFHLYERLMLRVIGVRQVLVLRIVFA